MEGKHTVLVEIAFREGPMFFGRGGRTVSQVEAHRKFNNFLDAGKIREAVWFLTERDQGDLLLLIDACTKTRKPMEEVLLENPLSWPPPRSTQSATLSQSFLTWTSQIVCVELSICYFQHTAAPD